MKWFITILMFLLINLVTLIYYACRYFAILNPVLLTGIYLVIVALIIYASVKVWRMFNTLFPKNAPHEPAK